MFQLTKDEWDNLKKKIEISKNKLVPNWNQFEYIKHRS